MEKTNFQMIMGLIDMKFQPKQWGVLDASEIKTLREAFNIGARTNLELQNLRDFVVLYFSTRKATERERKHYKKLDSLHDLMSGICGVIDDEKIERGMEV